ncbi:MAG TPA: hypothetical protein VFX28_11285, partial [Methylomirabilota bacterium]|nr:hypothetical protein [Methylomirabilota bacterium]
MFEVAAPVGQAYIVAIASREPFDQLPWYLRPFNAQAEGVGYVGGPENEEEGITAEGRIVGDPFVAMEKIRRRVLAQDDDPDAFATGYATYYVHNEVRYPRYLCYDCHRPGRWAWWDGFDPYYTHCSVFDFRVNWGWGWGPSYWFGTVPYYCYVVRHTCPPYYQPYIGTNIWFSSWDGWGRWSRLWGDHLVRFKSDPPAGYTPPSRYRDGSGRAGNPRPPGFLATDYRNGGRQPRMVTGRNYEARRGDMAPRDEGSVRGRAAGGGVSYRPRADRTPGRQQGDSYEASGGTRGGGMRERGARPAPGVERTPRDEAPAPRVIRPRDTAPPEHKPREESSRSGERRAQPTPAQQPPDARGG